MIEALEQPEALLPSESDLALIKQWQARIIRAKRKWEPDFKRMRENMEFVSGLQWPGQTTIDTQKYVNNITLRLVNQKVASLYAKNPTAIATRRQRLDFQMWDGEIESLMEAINQAAPIAQAGIPLPPELAAFFADVEAGRMKQKLVERVGKTLEIVYGYSIDSQKPEFKQQLKQCVRRAIICGVAYGRPVFCRDGYDYKKPSSIDHRSGEIERASRAEAILSKVGEGDVDENSATVGTLRHLAASLGVPSAGFELPERLDFDFPPATSIIVDERCRSLVDFVAARWIVQEYVLPVEEVNAIFDVDISVSKGQGSANEYGNGLPDVSVLHGEDTKNDFFNTKLVTLWEVFDYNTKTRFFICDGWKEFVLAPESPFPEVSGFWHHFALLFNETEVESDCKTSLFPPSDVQTVKSAQMEWNRTREDLRDQRRASSPVWMCRKGMLTESDKELIAMAVPNQVVELEGIPPDQPMERFFARRPVAPIDPAMYDTAPLEQDIMLGGGMQQANLGPAQPNVTATVGTIAEQSRLNVSASNIDDLDGFLSRLAQAGGEMLLQEMSLEVVKKIAGDGAVWPTLPETRAEFINEVFLKIEAASSGRPNKAVDVANWRDLAPLMLQAGANPVGIVHETGKRLDDTMDVTKFFPLLPPKSLLSSSGGEAPPNQAEQPSQSSNGDTGQSSPPSPAMVSGNDGGPQNARVATV